MKNEPTELHPLTFTTLGAATQNVVQFLSLQNQQGRNDEQKNNRATYDRDKQSERDLVQGLKKGTA